MGSRTPKIGPEWLPQRPLRKSLGKVAEKGAHLTPVTWLNCTRGLKNHSSGGGGKSPQKGPPRATFWRPSGLPSHPRDTKMVTMSEMCFWYHLWEPGRLPCRGGDPPVTGYFWRPCGEDHRRGRENLTRLMTPKGSADIEWQCSPIQCYPTNPSKSTSVSYSNITPV